MDGTFRLGSWFNRTVRCRRTLSRRKPRLHHYDPCSEQLSAVDHRHSRQLRPAALVIAVLAIGYGLWLLIDHQSGWVGLVAGGLAIASTYFTFGATVAYIEKYDAEH